MSCSIPLPTPPIRDVEPTKMVYEIIEDLDVRTRKQKEEVVNAMCEEYGVWRSELIFYEHNRYRYEY